MTSSTVSVSDLMETPIEKGFVSTSDGAAFSAASNPSPSLADPPLQVRKRRVFWLLIKNSGVWVSLGIGLMLLGIGIVQAALLPRIFTCPKDAICPNSFNPNSTNVLQLVQALMAYWLVAGTTAAGFGLFKLCTYQSWFIVMRHGNTIENLDLNLGAIKGSIFDACRLIFRKGNRWLGTLVLAHIGIGTAISLLVGLSISRMPGQRLITFNYASVSRLPDSSLRGLNSDGQIGAIGKVVSWALTNDTSHGSALRGTLVTPDGRSDQTVNVRPGGFRISGHIACSGVDNYTILSDGRYDISIRERTYFAELDMQLAVSMTSVDTALTHYLWVSNTTGLLPNATLTSDGKLNIAFCNHTIGMTNVTLADQGMQYIDPNVPVVSGCESIDPSVCVSDSVNNAVLSWWGGVGTAFWKVQCRGGVLGPLKTDGTICPLSTELWSETVTSMLDGIVQTAPRSGLATQQLIARVENISNTRWWLQGIIPMGILLLYGVALYYTYELSQGDSTLKELNLSEVIEAAQTDHVRHLVATGQLKKSTIRYGSDVGFIDSSQ